MQNKLFYYSFGSALLLSGLYIWSTGGFDLPTRHPPRTIPIYGLAHLLFGLSPFAAGISQFLLGRDDADDLKKWIHALIWLAILSMCSALLVANKANG